MTYRRLKWNRLHQRLSMQIKPSKNDDYSSYEHISTVYYLFLNKDPHAVVKTTFRGNNAYDGVVKRTVVARVNVGTSEVVSQLTNTMTNAAGTEN
nr:MAG TPA: hypothetical protein [Caudoviricetes sp.]